MPSRTIRPVVLLLCGLAAVASIRVDAAPAAGTEQVLDTINAPSPISAYGGVVVWSSYDRSARRYVLRALHDGNVVTLPVGSRRSPFDADVGPDMAGEPVIVYSRCRHDVTGGLTFNDLPKWGQAVGCDLYRFEFSDRRPHRLGASSRFRSEVLPSIWRGQLAFFGTQERRRHPRGASARLFIGAATKGGTRRSYAGGTQGPLDRWHGHVIDGPSPTGIDLRGTTVTFGWSNLRHCTRGIDSGGAPTASEIWMQSHRTRSRLDHSCSAYGVFGPFFADSAVRWLRQLPNEERGAVALEGGDGAHPLKPYTFAATPDNDRWFFVRGTLTGPIQVIAAAEPLN
jgi:hypothetical protein